MRASLREPNRSPGVAPPPPRVFCHLDLDSASSFGQIDLYKLIVANIHNVFTAHIHLGARGVNGPVVVFLFGPVPPGGGRFDGVLAEGTITAAHLTGPLAGKSLHDLLKEMASGNAYVNVHTNDGKDPPNTGPGDMLSGEIRGQIDHRVFPAFRP